MKCVNPMRRTFACFLTAVGCLVAMVSTAGFMATANDYGKPADKYIVSGIPWYDQRDSIVSAHGANIIYDSGLYYMFGEFKTDSVNAFKGFSCYSSPDLVNWTFERIAFKTQPEGRMGPGRVGERPKVLKCPSTGQYVMIMHSDDIRYKDPCTVYATSPTINGEYEYQGPLLYKGNPIKKWDIGSFTDYDGNSYLLVHHGEIYRLAEDYHSLDSCMNSNVKGVGESPAMLYHNGLYYWFSSHTTSWERNDNMYVSAPSLSGPWSEPAGFAPPGSNTWNSQTTFILPIVTATDTTFMFMGDRWSFPKQRSAATYVWQPVVWNDGEPSLPEYLEAWCPDNASSVTLAFNSIDNSAWNGSTPGETKQYNITVNDHERVYIKGETSDNSGYAQIQILTHDGNILIDTTVDFYSLTPASGLRYVSPAIPKGDYILRVTICDMKSNWSDKKKNVYGSKGHNISITQIGTLP